MCPGKSYRLYSVFCLPYSAVKEFVIGLKFAGRKQPRFFPRLLRRSSVLGNTPSFDASRNALVLAALCGVAWLLLAVLGSILGSPFASPFAFPLAYAAHHAAVDVGIGWWIAAAILLFGTAWIYPARRLRRRPFDGLFLALLAFELFFLLRWQGLLAPPIASSDWETLPALEKCSLILAVLLLVSLLAAWMLRPGQGKAFQMSAPTRVTGFLKKRRRRMLLIGGTLMIVAVGGTVVAAVLAFGGNVPGIYRGDGYEIVLAPAMAVLVFFVCDLVYLSGRHYWYRLT